MDCHEVILFNSGAKSEFLLHSMVKVTSGNLAAGILEQENLNPVTSIYSLCLYSATTM